MSICGWTRAVSIGWRLTPPQAMRLLPPSAVGIQAERHESTLQSPEAGRPRDRTQVDSALSPLRPVPFPPRAWPASPVQAPPSPPTLAPSSRPQPTRSPRPDFPTSAQPLPLTLTRWAPRADTAHGREPRHASPRSGPGPSACRGSGRGRHQGGENPSGEGGGNRASATAPGRGNRSGDVNAGGVATASLPSEQAGGAEPASGPRRAGQWKSLSSAPRPNHGMIP